MGSPGRTLRAYVLLAWTWCRVAAQHPVSLALPTLGQAVVTGLDIAAIALIFGHLPRLAGFSVVEVLFLAGTSGAAFALADFCLGSVERLCRHIRPGNLDTVLVRPVSPLVQVAVDQFAPRRLGKLAQSLAVLAVALPRLPVTWTPGRVLVVPLTVGAGAVIAGSIWVLGAALQFVATDAAEVASAFTYGGDLLTQYPLSIYGRDMIRAFTWVVPLAFVNWEPALYVLARPDPLGLPSAFRFLSPAVAVVLALAAGAAWRAGLRRYRSTGS